MIWGLIAILAVAMLLFAVVSQGGKSKNSGRRRDSSSRHQRVGHVDREFVSRKWLAIEGLSQGNGASLRDAVSEADKLLDYVLKGSGVRGETMGERLKNSGSRFSNINAIWQAHKLRNALAHEADFDLVPTQAREAIHDFERGLRDLGAL
jgi:hypothetical protein